MSGTLQLQSLPLFPLRTVLFPGGSLSLQIFEVRYLDMVAKAFAAGAPFGVATLTEGSEVRRRADAANGGTQPPSDAFAPESFHTIGTLARITELSSPQPGLKVIHCQGTQRFAITHSRQLRHGLWVADINFLLQDQTVRIPSDLQIAADALAQVLHKLQPNPATQAMPIQPPFLLDDCAWVANRWCELLPIAPEVKHRLMSLDNPLVRLELVHDLLVKNSICP